MNNNEAWNSIHKALDKLFANINLATEAYYVTLKKSGAFDQLHNASKELIKALGNYYSSEEILKIKQMSSSIQAAFAKVTAQYNFAELYSNLSIKQGEIETTSSTDIPVDDQEIIIEKQNQILDATEQYLKTSEIEKQESIINTVDSLRKKEPWSRGDKLTLASIIVTILIAIVTLLKSDSTENKNTEINVNINSNINLYSNNGEKKDMDSRNEINHIKFLSEILSFISSDDTESSDENESSISIDEEDNSEDNESSESATLKMD